MKVFVTGATGFVGREVVRQLHEAGHGIRILTRSGSARKVQELVTLYGTETHTGDVLEPGSLAGGLNGTDAVIHLVGIISEAGERTFERVHTEGTRNMVTATQRAGVRRYLHMSALGTRPGAVSRYHQTKWAAEEIVRRSGLEFTIFRPSLIFGPQDHFTKLFAKLARLSPVIPVLGSGGAQFQPIWVKAVARAFARALTEPKSAGQTYDLCGPERFTLPEMLDQILAEMGKKRWKQRVPFGLARGGATVLEFVFAGLLRKPPPLNRDQLTMLQEDNVGNARPANQLFGLEPVTFREGIGRYLTVRRGA